MITSRRTSAIAGCLLLPLAAGAQGGPDVLAWDAAWRRLYVGSESGALSAFWLDRNTLRAVGEVRAPHAHTVSVDPRTHRVYLPLENVNGKPVLRIYEPVK